MDVKLKNQLVYKEAQEYLMNIKPPDIDDLNKYFVGDRKDFTTLQDVYEQIIHSAQNYQRMPNVIKFNERQDKIKEILYFYDFDKIKDYKIDELYYKFRAAFDVTSEDSKHNSWRKWSKSIITAANFMNDFKSIDDFRNFVDLFKYNLPTRMALPLLMQTKINGMGFALACDCLKELGYLDYPKPDVHLIDVFVTLDLSEKEPINVFEAIVRMAEYCKEIDEEVTPYKIDKIIWLICSGRFYLDDISIGRHKEEFIESTRNKIKISELC